MSGQREERVVINNWAVVILQIGQPRDRPPSVIELTKELDCTYSSLTTTTQELANRGLITRKKLGRVIVLELTTKGEEMKEAITTMARLTTIRNYSGRTITASGIEGTRWK